MDRVLIVLAKSPVPGRVKTRLCPPATPRQAADLAAAALADTLAAARQVGVARIILALDGPAAAAPDGAFVTAPDGAFVTALDGPAAPALVTAPDGAFVTALGAVTVIPQRGDSLGERIAAAHADVAELMPGACTVQIGMDTPQCDPTVLRRCLDAVARPGGPDALLGPAADGGWWALGLRDPRHAELLRHVPTSRADTGASTWAALAGAGLRVAALPRLVDVDTIVDAYAVARACPRSRFAATLRATALHTTALHTTALHAAAGA